MNKITLFFISFLLVLLASSCEGDESATAGIPLSCFDGFRDGDEVGVDCGGSCDTDCPVYINPIGGEIIWRTVLKTGTVYTITEPIIIRDQSILEIQAGVTIKVVPHIGAHIAIAQGGQLNCNGSADAPIIFESLSDNPSPGDWGGILAMGKASTNNPNHQMTTAGSYLYGGIEDYDYSLKLNFVKIKHAGEKINQEVQAAVGLYGVGFQSQINQVEFAELRGAALKIVGGTPNLGKLYIHDAAAGIHATDGWRGSVDEVYLKNIESSPFVFDNPIDQLAEPKASVFMDRISFVGSANESLFSLRNGGAELQLSNWYVNGVTTFMDLDQDSQELIANDQVLVNPIEFENTAANFNLLSPENLDTSFIINGATNGAGAKEELPSWLYWVN